MTIKKACDERHIPEGILIDEIRDYHIKRMKETRKGWRRFERRDGKDPGGVPDRDGRMRMDSMAGTLEGNRQRR